MRSLTPEESTLWARVASTIRPLSREQNESEAASVAAQVQIAPKTSHVRRSAARAPEPRRVVGSTLDGSWDKRLASGNVEPDRTVDLHGMSLDRAWRAIDLALDQAVARGERVLLLITGHQRSGQPPVRRGAIRAAVHDWLAASRHAAEIAAVRGAHRRHGGGGSLYLILRRRDRPR